MVRSRLRPGSSPVDLNYLYRRHRVSLFMSDHAACDRSRATHRAFTRAYASMIAGRRQHLAVAA